MKHLLILLTLTCYSHASAEKTLAISYSQQNSIQSELKASQVQQSVATTISFSSLSNGVSQRQVNSISNSCLVYLFQFQLIDNYCQGITAVPSTDTNDDKRMCASDYSNKVRKKISGDSTKKFKTNISI